MTICPHFFLLKTKKAFGSHYAVYHIESASERSGREMEGTSGRGTGKPTMNKNKTKNRR